MKEIWTDPFKTAREEAEKNRIKHFEVLGADWKKDPSFKEYCRKEWDPEFFAQCEKIIAGLEMLRAIENREKKCKKFFDIATIDVSGKK